MDPVRQDSPNSSTEQIGETPRTKNAGRKKIRIIRITDSRSRQVTFLKRKNGLLKKAHELSILCGCNVAVVIFNNDNGKLYEYFNPSAEETFNRYAVYTGVSERRRSDVTQLEEAKGTCDIPNEEPEVAEAALAAANMSAIRHAHPENYEYPPLGRPQVHPNVTVPAIRMPHPPVPVHPAMGGSSSRNSIAGPSSRPLLLHTPTTEEPPRVGQTLGSAHSNRNIAGRNYSMTMAGTPQAIRPLPFHLDEPTITPRTAENQISACFGLPALASNEQPQQRENNHRQTGDIEPETRNQQNSLGSLCTPSNPRCDEITPEIISRDVAIDAEDVRVERPSAALNPVPPADLTSARPPGVEIPSSNRNMESALFATGNSSQPSPPSTVSPWSGQQSASTTPRTPAGQPWNTPFFRQQMREAERLEIQPVLPPLTPLLGYLPNPESQFNALDTDAGNFLSQTGFDALPSPSDAGLIPLSMAGPVSSNPLPSMGLIRNRDPDESWDEGSVRNRQRLDQ